MMVLHYVAHEKAWRGIVRIGNDECSLVLGSLPSKATDHTTTLASCIMYHNTCVLRSIYPDIHIRQQVYLMRRGAFSISNPHDKRPPLPPPPHLSSLFTPSFVVKFIYHQKTLFTTYDHRRMKTGHPVRSGVLKHSTGCVVVGWVTTSEFQLLYVLFLFAFF